MKYHRSSLFLPVLVVVALLATLVPHASAQPPAQPPRIDKSAPYGVVGNLAENVRNDEQKAMIQLLSESQAQWHREEFSWERLQPERGGPYRWKGDGYGFLNWDESIQRLRDANVNILGLLAYNPAWFKGKNPPIDDWIGDWQLYVYNVVARYGRDRKQIKHWEIWNEPNLRGYGYENGLYSIEDYARLLRATHEMIQRADPQATIVLGGLANIWSEVPEFYYDTFDYLDLLGKAGAWPYFDIISIHAYRPGPPEGSFQRRDRFMDLDDEMRELDRLMDLYGQKPVWFTEMSWGAHAGPYGVSEREQAYFLVRIYALALHQPRIEKVFWYSFRNNLAYWTPYDQLLFDDTVPDWHMGLIRRSYPLNPDAHDLRKPAFLAFRTMVNLLGGLPQLERRNTPGIYWFRYGSGQRGVDLLWHLEGTGRTVAVQCGCREARVRSWNGALVTIARTDTGTIEVVVPPGGEPIYVEYGPDRQTGGTYFPETGHRLSGGFLQFWQRNGGLAQFGYPISGELIEPDPNDGRARVVQYFERNRFEYFPEHQGTPYVVQLGRLGDDQLSSLGVRWQDMPTVGTTPPGCRVFNETKRTLCPPFREYWEKRGGLAIYGLPLTDAFMQNGRLVQYFERNRFEHHPELAGTPYEVLLGLLGVELFAGR
jgi:hypothetical protein